jgi:hypothetical protein
MSIIPNLIYRFNEIPVKIPISYWMDFDKCILNLIQSSKKIQNREDNIEEKECWNNDTVSLLNLIQHYINQQNVARKNRQRDQWN